MGLILLTILKIIGICLLAILAILLLILLLLLFVPVRYRSTGRISAREKQVSAKVSYLASAVSVSATYQDGSFAWAVKVFGIRILPKKSKEKRAAAKTSEDKKKSVGKDGKREVPAAEKNRSERNETAKENSERPENISVEENEHGRQKSVDKEERNTGESPSENNREDSFGEIKKNTTGKEESTKKNKRRTLRERFSDMKDRYAEFQRKKEDTSQKISRWKEFYHRDETQTTLRMLKTEAKNLIHYLMPTRIRAHIHFGFDDPSDTGVMLGLISAAYGFFPKGIDLQPDFEKKVLEGEWTFRGRVRLIYFLRLALRVALKPENRITCKRLRKLTG